MSDIESLFPGETIKPFRITASCNFCHRTFTHTVNDTNPGDAQGNFFAALTLGHGLGFGMFGQPVGEMGSGKNAHDYIVSETIELPPTIT